MKVLFAQEYVERVLFVLEHDGKYITVYRSSGLSGTGHGSEILPFSSLCTRTNLYGRPNIGYIYKEMFYNSMWISHRKELHKYQDVKLKMDYLKNFLKDINPEQSYTIDEETFDVIDFNHYVYKTQNKIDKIIREMKPYDLSKEF